MSDEENTEASAGAEATPAGPIVDPAKQALKARIATLRQQRDEALEAHDGTKLKLARRRMRALKRRLRKLPAAQA